MSVKIVKLISGEDVVSETIETNDDVTLKNPTMLIVTEQGVGLSMYSPLTEGDIVINRHHILWMCAPRSEVLNAYNTKFAGIVRARPEDLQRVSQPINKNKLVI